MSDEAVLREQLDADYGRLIGQIRKYAQTLDCRDKVEMKRLEDAVKVERALLNGHGRQVP